MHYVMLNFSLPLPADASGIATLPHMGAPDDSAVLAVPDVGGTVSPELLRFEHFLGLLGQLRPGAIMELSYPWTGLLALSGNLGRTKGRITVLRRSTGRGHTDYTELFDLHIALDEGANPIRHVLPHLAEDRPVVVILRNTAVPMSGELRFFERNKAALAAAGVATMLGQARTRAPEETVFH